MDLILNAMETQKCFDLHNERNWRMTGFNREYKLRNNHNSNKNQCGLYLSQ